MATFNLQIDIDGCLLGHKRLLFDLEENALDYIQQAAGTDNCIQSIIDFLTNCVEQNVIELNVEELKKNGSQITVSIPKRNIKFSTSVQSINEQNKLNSNNENEGENHIVHLPNNSQINTNDVEPLLNENNHNSSWTEGITKFMLEKYSKLMSYVGPMKKLKKKIDLWKQLATDIDEEFGIRFTYLQVENRYKTVCKRKKTIIDNNRKTGASRLDDTYEEEWALITKKDDSILPEVLRSAKRVVMNCKKDCSEQSEPQKKKFKSKTTDVDTLLDFLKMKEAEKERRHKEKMDLIKSLLK